MLTAPIAEPDRVVLVASYRGGPNHPAWFLNLRDRPRVRAMRKGHDQDMHAEVLTGDARAGLWNEVCALQPRYAKYQTRTEREIPLVVLTPVT